jgi:hypothetical protein
LIVNPQVKKYINAIFNPQIIKHEAIYFSCFPDVDCSVVLLAQQPAVQNASIPKDAQVDVTVKDFKGQCAEQ